jgi:hypothetical protein
MFFVKEQRPMSNEADPALPRARVHVLPEPQRQTVIHQFKVELDDRCILLPDGKIIHHLLIYQDETKHIAIDGVFAFNLAQTPPRLLRLQVDDARALAAELIASVYAAKTGFVFAGDLKISIIVVANGYRLEIASGSRQSDLFLSAGVIWRVVKGLLTALDAASPMITN